MRRDFWATVYEVGVALALLIALVATSCRDSYTDDVDGPVRAVQRVSSGATTQS